MKRDKKDAQILLITLLVLMIVAIIVVGIIVYNNRDVGQTVANQKYETALNNSETELKKIVTKYGDYTTDITNLPTDNTQCLQITTAQIECAYTTTQNNVEINNEITVKNSKLISNYEIKKDQSLELVLNNYKNGLDIRWDKNTAIEFTLISYTDSNNNNLKDVSENYKIVKDVYDKSGIYDSLIADDPYNDSGNIHALDFKVLDSNDLQKTTQILLQNTSGITASDKLVSLRIMPRTKNEFDSIQITITPLDIANFPYQIREFIAMSYIKDDEDTSVVKVMTQIPLYPQVSSIFDYSLITNDTIRN